MLLDDDQTIQIKSELEEKLFRAIESQVKTYFLSRQVMSYGICSIKYNIMCEHGKWADRVRTIPISVDLKLHATLPLKELYNVFVQGAWQAFLKDTTKVNKKLLYVPVSYEWQNYDNFLDKDATR